MATANDAPVAPAAERTGGSLAVRALAAALLLATACLVLVDAVTPRRLATIDEGQWLFFARALMDGGVLYRDVWYQFGPLLLYPLVGAFSVFGETLAVARAVFWAMNALGLLCGGFALAALTRSLGWTALGVFLLECNALICRAINVNPTFLMRQCLPLLALALAAWSWRAARPALLWWAGGAAGLAVLSSQETGLFTGAALVAAALLEDSRRGDGWRWPGLAPARPLVLGAAVPLLAWCAFALASGGLGSYLTVSFLDTLVMVSGSQHQPLADWGSLLGSDVPPERVFRGRAQWVLTYFPWAVIAAGAWVWRARGRAGDAIDRGFTALLLCALLFWTVNLGRADRAHAAFAAGPAIVLGVVLLAQARRRREWILAGVSALALAGMWASSLDRVAAFDSDEAFSADFPRSGGAGIRVRQAVRVRQLVGIVESATAPGDAILAIPHEPALHFFAERRSPTRFASPVFANREHHRSEMLEALRADPPALIVRSAEGRIPGIDYGYYLEQIEPILEGYCRDPRTSGPTEIWLRKPDPASACESPAR